MIATNGSNRDDLYYESILRSLFRYFYEVQLHNNTHDNLTNPTEQTDPIDTVHTVFAIICERTNECTDRTNGMNQRIRLILYILYLTSQQATSTVSIHH